MMWFKGTDVTILGMQKFSAATKLVRYQNKVFQKKASDGQ